jgi:hypothetical protein
MTLVDFLEARLGEDCQAARAIEAGGPWSSFGTSWEPGSSIASKATFHMDNCDTHVEITSDVNDCVLARDYLMRHDPARVLREVGAKRRILEDYVRSVRQVSEGLSVPQRRAVGALASVYDGHPDFREEWRP